MLTDILQRIGMTAIESEVYLACLKLGTQDVKSISKNTGLSRQDALTALNGLTDRGYMSRFSSHKDFFTPEYPDVLLKILLNKQNQMGEQIEFFKENLPSFEDYINPSFTKPEIAFYEGTDGMIAAYEDTLTSKTDILAIASIDELETEDGLTEYVPRYYKRRKAAGILIRAIFPDTDMSRKRQKHDEKELRESKLLPADILDFHIELNIYDDKVAYFSLAEKLAIIVKSAVIADSMRNVFQLCWKMGDYLEKAQS